MGVYLITYTTPLKGNDITEELEWITDSDWDSERTIQCFQRRFPHASIVGFQPLSGASVPAGAEHTPAASPY